jgi:energy-coupling factor transport system ATP-binding protein
MDEAIGADRVVVMSEGAILMDGKPCDVFSRVEALREAGLDVPETVSLLYELNEDGFGLRLDALTVEECAQEIFSALA